MMPRSRTVESLSLISEIGSEASSIKKMSRLLRSKSAGAEAEMGFLDHLDELRRRLVNSVIIVVIAFVGCWMVSDKIYDFLSVPIRRTLSEAERRELPIAGRTGEEKILPISSLSVGDQCRYAFDRATKLGASVVQPGTSVTAVVERDGEGTPGLFTTEPLITANAVIPSGVRLPADLAPDAVYDGGGEERMVVTTAVEPFTLYVTVSLYS